MTVELTSLPYPTEPFASSALAKLPFTLLAGPDVLEGDGSINLQSAHYLKAMVDRLSKTYAIEYYFKSSYDKANRTSITAYRGPGAKQGLEMLKRIQGDVGVKLITDVHSVEEATLAGTVVDMIQVPAFLSRQTDLLLAAGDTGKIVNIKKGQFLSPHDTINAVEKVKSTGNTNVFVTERGTTFGYNNLVVDMRGVPIVQGYGVPVIFDATHSIQLPGGQGTSSGGQREYAITLARAAVAAGCNGLFFETHPDPATALCDGPNMLPLTWMEPLLETCLSIRSLLLQSAAKTASTSAQPVLV
ncbi:MAG: 3-deoxy-8-phosphooctulonate synthase [Vampirovibrionales bacterium]|nr:3-deoxy-8-phosphooctulonate synthase [Vampirovibrionales bacterium]